MLIRERLFVIHTSYATFGIITGRYNNKVIDAAPIAKWAVGKNIAYVLKYYKHNKSAEITMMFISRAMKGITNK